ncbi:hypothetical protein C2G38_102612 [Gigaspora rosea]|uniref:Secreted protein n=1 Tax=Gigaspora rosea TaxID=44941 RepID=A0A397UVG1_9GLOM|nr:hypothetical protein C2G38_102612 [Gigaspora rosea]
MICIDLFVLGIFCLTLCPATSHEQASFLVRNEEKFSSLRNFYYGITNESCYIVLDNSQKFLCSIFMMIFGDQK